MKNKKKSQNIWILHLFGACLTSLLCHTWSLQKYGNGIMVGAVVPSTANLPTYYVQHKKVNVKTSGSFSSRYKAIIIIIIFLSFSFLVRKKSRAALSLSLSLSFPTKQRWEKEGERKMGGGRGGQHSSRSLGQTGPHLCSKLQVSGKQTLQTLGLYVDPRPYGPRAHTFPRPPPPSRSLSLSGYGWIVDGPPRRNGACENILLPPPPPLL